MKESTKLLNWTVLLVLVLIFMLGFVAFVLVGAVIAQAMPVLGGSMILTGFASIAASFYSLKMMEQFA